MTKNKIKLSELEILVLEKLAHGTNLRKFAKEINISEHNIYKISKNIKEKFKARNMVQAVALATEYEIID